MKIKDKNIFIFGFTYEEIMNKINFYICLIKEALKCLNKNIHLVFQYTRMNENRSISVFSSAKTPP